MDLHLDTLMIDVRRVINMYYVGAYGDEGSDGNMYYSFIGWSKNKLAIMLYNVAGRRSLPFYEHYEVFEYSDMPEEKFVDIVYREWGVDISDWTDSDDYIDIYESRHGDIISITNREYNELVVISDTVYDQGRKHMSTAYELITTNKLKLIRNEKVFDFVMLLMKRYMGYFKGTAQNPLKLNEHLDGLQSFICMVKDDEIMQYYY